MFCKLKLLRPTRVVVVQTEPHVDVVVPTPAVLASPVMKIKRLSELGVVRSISGKKKKKSSAKKKK